MLSFLIFSLAFAAGFILGVGRGRRVQHTVDHYHLHGQQVTITIEHKFPGDPDEDWKR